MQLNPEAFEVPPIHFIGGVHGVGKTTFASSVSDATGILCKSAGALIKSHRDSTQGAAKQVKNVPQNQNLLLESIAALHMSSSLLLDGHFCLLTKDNAVTRIPFDTFANLNLKS